MRITNKSKFFESIWDIFSWHLFAPARSNPLANQRKERYQLMWAADSQIAACNTITWTGNKEYISGDGF